MADSQRAREAPGATGSGQTEPLREIRPRLFCVLVVALGLTSMEATAQTVTGLTTTPAGFSSFQAPLSLPGTAWPTVQSAVPALWTPSGAVTAPGPPLPTAPPFLLTGAISVAEGYATNPLGQTSTNAANPSAFTQGGVDLGLHYDSLRLKVDAHSSTYGYYYYNATDANQYNQYLNLVANSELIPNHLFFNFNATATPVALTRIGQLSATPGFAPSSNNQQSYGYFANPVYRTHFGDYVASQTSFSYSQLFFSQPFATGTVSTLPVVPLSTTGTVSTIPVVPLENTTSSTISQGFSSGPYFGRLKWNVTAAYSNIDQTGQPLLGQSQQETLGIFSGAYAINRVFSVLGVGGYDRITTSFPLTQDLPPLVALGGARFTFGPKFLLAAAAGVSHGFPTYLGSLNWNVTSRFAIVGSLTESISSSQGNILNNLSTLAVSSQGVFSDAQSYFWQTQQQAFFPQFATISPVPLGGSALTNGLSRTQQANLSFVHTDERNTYGLSLFGNVQDLLSSPIPTTQLSSLTPAQLSSLTPAQLSSLTPAQLASLTAQSQCQPIGSGVLGTPGGCRSSVVGAQLSASRNLRRELTGYAAVSYALINQSGRERAFTANVGLNYSLSPKTNAYISAQYLNTQSSGQVFFGGVPSQATVMVGMRYKLGSTPTP